MPKALLSLFAAALLSPVQAPAPAPAAGTPAARFAGVWVGTQGWAIPSPPPGARQDQPVTVTLLVVNGRVTGTLKPFLGGEEGATIVNAAVVGDELQATAVVGTPRTAAPRGEPAWKDSVRVRLMFKHGGETLSGRADVTMNDVPWVAFRYALSKKRSRY
jgi:hypothetical protein